MVVLMVAEDGDSVAVPVGWDADDAAVAGSGDDSGLHRVDVTEGHRSHGHAYGALTLVPFLSALWEFCRGSSGAA